MEHELATEHLQVIRTLMERSALYRRTLAPIMLYVGSVGALAALGGIALEIGRLGAFCAWWLAAAVAALSGAFVIARRQALADGEPFWSPPTLRVTQAIMPPLAAGLVLSLALSAFAADDERWLFVLSNTLLYGCAVHAAGFFTPRGLRLFGWLAILFAGAWMSAWSLVAPNAATARFDHALMGAFFGVAHLAYGIYLYATEPGRTAG